MRLGAHVSTAGGISNAIDRAQEIGAETIQIFASSPRAWAFKRPSEKEILEFRKKAEAADVSPVFFHGSYLINVGGTPELVEKSIGTLINQMAVASQVGAAGVIFHGGSHKGLGFDTVLDQAAAALKKVLLNSPSDVWLVLENSAGMGSHIGSSFEEIGQILNSIDSERVMVCLDTQHCMAAGYDIGDSDGINKAMDQFDKHIGLSRLVAVHANDSKVEFGSGVDRHENIGEGHLGIQGFETIMAHSAFKNIPFMLEVPGADKNGPDKENLDRLKKIRSELNLST